MATSKKSGSGSKSGGKSGSKSGGRSSSKSGGKSAGGRGGSSAKGGSGARGSSKSAGGRGGSSSKGGSARGGSSAKGGSSRGGAGSKSGGKSGGKSATKRAPNPAFMRPMQPDEQLGAVIGTNPMPRTEITKRLWDYIKKNNLQDAKERRNINADDKLRLLFGGKRQVTMFDLTKIVNQHISSTES